MLVGALLGLYLGFKLPGLAQMVLNSKYSRKSLDDIMLKLVGKSRIEDALSEEVLIVAYDYNTQEPRFFSKYYASVDPSIYNVTFNEATGASSAAPTFFDPKVRDDGYGFSELLIDGGVICNDPAMYAYQMAKNFHMKKHIRVVSLGTGEKAFETIDAKTVNFKKLLPKMGEFMMNMDTYTADNYLNHSIPNARDPTNPMYLRGQVECEGKYETDMELRYGGEKYHFKTGEDYDFCPMDDISPMNIEGLKMLGDQMWNNQRDKLELVLRNIIDERWGP